jgi:adenylyltransferase/sulfurtransferase
VGEYKTKVPRRLWKPSIHPKIIEHRLRLDASNALDIIRQYDIVADGCDNFPPAFWSVMRLLFCQKPLVSAAVASSTGRFQPSSPTKNAPSGEPWPPIVAFMASFGQGFSPCEEVGILGRFPALSAPCRPWK